MVGVGRIVVKAKTETVVRLQPLVQRMETFLAALDYNSLLFHKNNVITIRMSFTSVGREYRAKKLVGKEVCHGEKSVIDPCGWI